MFCERPQDKDIICALATPPGEGAVALIRLSGKGAFKVGRNCCPFLPEKIKSHHIYFGTFKHPESKEALDEVLVFCFEEGRSFTGEESIEISCHGGVYLSSVILEALVSAGARMAEKGEFSYRSFMNGKMDLLQAESVLELIQSRSPKAHRQAMRGLKGALSTELSLLEKNLLKLLSHLEASIDFSDQEIEPFSWEQQQAALEEIQKRVIKIVKGFQQGRINREGFSVILLGAPNAGKSSLFNCLIQEDKAIVTKHPGTTRDILSARLLLNQREFCLKDTAGFRESPDIVEKKGIEKVFEELSHSDLCLFLVEGSLPFEEQSVFGLEQLDESKTIVVFSKSDRLGSSEKKLFLEKFICFCEEKEAIKKFSEKVQQQPLWLSSRTGEGIEELKETLSRKSEREIGEVFLSTPRQRESLEKMNSFLDQAKILFDKKASPEFIAFELQSALSVLYGLLGKEYNEEVIQQIFKEFCIGK